PDIPGYLFEAARGDRGKFGAALNEYLQANPQAGKVMPFVVAKTLGPVLGSTNLASLWGMLQTLPKSFRRMAARSGFDPGPGLGEELFQAILDHPEGLWIGRVDPEKNLEQSLRTESGLIELLIPELADQILAIDAETEEKALKGDERFPLVLMAGRHMDMNANTLMRDPAWNKDRRACTLAMHPGDAAGLGLKDGQTVLVTTEAGHEKIELETTDSARPGHVVIPHGFGMVYEGRVYGANVNRLTKNTHRDPLAATPLHRYVPCRVTPV
ncbi:MAG: molybdopterin dinucleotide binding domain-containing protein, partial [Thermodesulfobacteriota bacterium]|nr:molybdopterin dinucleotide binding domain-containing protein [Thermodesulfobacteriota bacterium]